MDTGRNSALSPVLVILVISATLIELTLQGADAGLWASTRLRILTYQYSAFWPGLLGAWTPNYALQPYAMFVTYAFLHGGLVHLVVNMITIVSLGAAVIRDVGQWRFVVIYFVSSFAGALVFALMTTSFRPMVGASGALFGLAGALVIWNIRYTFRHSASLTFKLASIVWPIGLLTLLNVLMFYGFDENVAWQTHLGGFLGGFVAGAFMHTDEHKDPLV